MKTKTILIPVSDRVLLEAFIPEVGDIRKGGIVIPQSAASSMAPKYRWLTVAGIGKGCLEVQMGDSVLVHESSVELVVVEDEGSVSYVRESQIIAIKRAESEKKAP